MPEIELLSEQHGIDDEGNHWILTYAGEPKEWKNVGQPDLFKAYRDAEVLDSPGE